MTTAVLASVATAPLRAHAMWFAQRAKQTALIYGVGADDLDTVKRFSQIEKMTCCEANYQPIRATPRIAGSIVVVDSEQHADAAFNRILQRHLVARRQR